MENVNVFYFQFQFVYQISPSSTGSLCPVYVFRLIKLPFIKNRHWKVWSSIQIIL